jgi:hypothetical protein
VVGVNPQSGDSLIERYLDELVGRLRGPGAALRRAVEEIEVHLHESVAEGMGRGLSEPEAERAAVERFGSPRLVARRFASEAAAFPSVPAFLQLAITLSLLAGIGLAAIGVSGVLAGGMGRALGKSFVSGDPPGVTYTAARCRDFLEYHPRPTCEQAATAHHFDEIVLYREAAGVLGLMVLGGYFIVRRRRDLTTPPLLPRGIVPIVGTTMFGGATVLLLGDSMGRLAFGQTSGPGGNLSGGMVSLVVLAGFAWSLRRYLRTRSPDLVSADPVMAGAGPR